MTESREAVAITADIIIIGAGIAGLWTLASARQKGYSAILLEKNCLGGGQSIASQGIIHGGSKYALAGKISQAANNIRQMPGIWQKAINGDGVIDLEGTEILSEAQFLLPAPGINSRLLSFLGSKSMSSFTQRISGDELPESYRQLGIHKAGFRLEEPVLDTRSLFNCFQQRYHDCLFRADIHPGALQYDKTNQLHTLRVNGQTLHSRALVIAAGAGIEGFAPYAPAMQKRPLHMVMVKSRELPAIYAHFIGSSSKPLLTVTSHATDNGMVWYLGGNLAENGVELDETQQIDQARKLLKKLLPDFTLPQDSVFAGFRVERAEPLQKSLNRPDDAFVSQQDNIIYGWPTKLALAPRFAEQALAAVDFAPGNFPAAKPDLPAPALADYPWASL